MSKEKGMYKLIGHSSCEDCLLGTLTIGV